MSSSKDKHKKVNGIPPLEKQHKPSNLKLKNYWILVAIRFGLIFLPQNGYIHPDEFFQSVEVLTGDIFELDTTRPWEFNTSYPLRSVVLPYVTVGLPCRILKWVSTFTSFWLGTELITPYILLVLPRLVTCCISLISDFCLWYMCYLYGQNYAARLTVFASSYVMLVFATRTFSNTVEMVLFSMLLCYVLDSMHFTDEVVWREDMILERYEAAGRDKPVERARLTRLRSSLPSYSVRNVVPIAVITVAGIFNRPTFIAFALPALFSWLHRGMGSRSVGWSHFHLRVATLCFYGLVATMLFITFDSVYYGYLTMAEIISVKLSISNNFVVTPLNFILYNIKPANLAEHGIHPRCLHLLVNVPLMFNILGIAGILGVISALKLVLSRQWLHLPKAQSITALMYASFIVPLIILSIFPHQEPRFLLPLIIPLTFLHAQTLRLHKKWLMPLWYTLNALCVLFYGFLHQGGIWGLLVHLHESGLAHPAPLNSVHIISNHVYSLPKFPLLLPSTSKVLIGPGGRRYRATRRVHIYETGSSESLGIDVAKRVLNQCDKDWKNHRLKCHVYCVYPGTLQSDFEEALEKFNVTHSPEQRMFYPHISTEAMPSFWGHACKDSCFTASSFFTRKLQELGLVLTQVK